MIDSEHVQNLLYFRWNVCFMFYVLKFLRFELGIFRLQLTYRITLSMCCIIAVKAESVLAS